MISRRRVLVTMVVVVVVVGAAGFAIGGWTQSGSDAAATEPSWLLSQTAETGTMTPNGDGTYQLVLDGVDPNVVAFTDRPDRDTAIMSVQNLASSWATMFASSAPNAVLVEHAPTGEANTVVVELFDPKVNGNSMSYTAVVLFDENQTMAPDGFGMGMTQHVEPPASFEFASLFIDSIYAKWACLDGAQSVIDPPGDVPPGGVTPAWSKQCREAGGSLGETFVVR